MTLVSGNITSESTENQRVAKVMMIMGSNSLVEKTRFRQEKVILLGSKGVRSMLRGKSRP